MKQSLLNVLIISKWLFEFSQVFKSILLLINRSVRIYLRLLECEQIEHK